MHSSQLEHAVREHLLLRLTDRQIDELEHRHPSINPLGAADLAAERARGVPQIMDLKRELGIQGRTSDEQAYALIGLAFEFFGSPCTASRGHAEHDPEGAFTITVTDCPVFDQMMASGRFNITNCPYWHRSRGWLEGLGGVDASSEITEEEGAPIGCRLTYNLRTPSPAPQP